MDIEKDSNREAFEAIAENTRLLRGAKFKDGEYVALSLFDESSKELAAQLNYGWSMWQAAKAQAALEKDAIIQKLSDQLYAQEMKTSAARVLCETACELLDDYAHQDAMVILNDLEQAMKEPANDS